jgi:chromosomal replication initiation ATPase DnaA
MSGAAAVPHLPANLAVAVAAAQFGLTRQELLCRRRAAPRIEARAFAVWMLRSLGTPASYPEIGKALGGRDHATIISLHRKAIALQLGDRRFAAACDLLARRFHELREIPHAC